jgi:hypothetical protein
VVRLGQRGLMKQLASHVLWSDATHLGQGTVAMLYVEPLGAIICGGELPENDRATLGTSPTSDSPNLFND